MTLNLANEEGSGNKIVQIIKKLRYRIQSGESNKKGLSNTLNEIISLISFCKCPLDFKDCVSHRCTESIEASIM